MPQAPAHKRRSFRRVTIILVATAAIGAAMAGVSGCRDTNDQGVAPQKTAAAPDPCAGMPGTCNRRAAVDVSGDGKPDGIAMDGSKLIIATQGTTHVADLATRDGHDSKYFQNPPMFAQVSKSGQEDIIFEANSSAIDKRFIVYSWRDNDLRQIGPPGPLMQGVYMDLWTFSDGEGFFDRAVCTTPGRMDIYTLASAYGSEKAEGYTGKHEVRYAPDPNAKGDASVWKTERSRDVLPESSIKSVIDRLPGKYFDCPSSAVMAGPTGTTTSKPSCDTDPTDEVDANIHKIPKFGTWDWVFTGRSNFNSCADLSYAELEVQGTGSSPYQLMMFHKGEFVGRGTACNLGYQTITSADQSSVSASYKYPRGNEPNAAPTGRFALTFTWTGSQVRMTGDIPREVYELTKCKQ